MALEQSSTEKANLEAETPRGKLAKSRGVVLSCLSHLTKEIYCTRVTRKGHFSCSQLLECKDQTPSFPF